MDWRMRVTLQATRARGTDELRGREIAPWLSYFALGLTGFGILMSLLIAVRLAIGR